MGNRAVITFSTAAQAPCVYLHWNGGRASVEAFLRAAVELGAADPTLTQAGAMDRLADVCRSFIGGSTYRELYGTADADNWDNGTYVIDRDTFAIEHRLHLDHCSSIQSSGEEVDAEKTAAIYAACIDNACDPWFVPQERPQGRVGGPRRLVTGEGKGEALLHDTAPWWLDPVAPWFMLGEPKPHVVRVDGPLTRLRKANARAKTKGAAA